MHRFIPFSPSFQEQRLLSQQMGIGFREGPKGPQQAEPQTPQEMINTTDNANQMKFMRGVLSMRNTPQFHSPDQVTAAPQYANNPEQYLSDLTQPVVSAHEAKMQELWSKRDAIEREGSFVEDVASMTAREKPKLVGERTAKWNVSQIDREINFKRLRGKPVTRDKWYEWQHAAKDLQAFGQRRDRMRTGQLNRNMFMDVMHSGAADDRILNEAALRQEARFPTEEQLVLTPVNMPVAGPQPTPRGPQFAPPQRPDRGFGLRKPGEEAQGMPKLSPEMTQLFADLPPDVQRPVARLIDGMSPTEKQALEEVGGKLVEILKDPQSRDIFLMLPMIDRKTGKLPTAEDWAKELQNVDTNENLAKNNFSPEALKKVSDFLSGLSPEQRNALERVLKGVTDIAQEHQRKTEGYSLDLEKNPAKKAKILKYAKRFTEAKTEEDRLIAEGYLRMEGVDVEGSDFAGGKVEMLPTEGRFIGLIVGFIQMTMGILRKLGGKKTTIERETASLQVPDKDPKTMTEDDREKELADDRKALSEGKTKEAKLETDIKGLKAKLKDDKLDEKTRPELTKRLGEVKKELSDLQAARAKMEQRIKDLEEANRIPVPENAESVSEKMTKFKTRLAKYKEMSQEVDKLIGLKNKIRKEHPMTKEEWGRLTKNPDEWKKTLEKWGFPVAAQERFEELDKAKDPEQALSLIRLDEDFDKLSATEKEFSRKNLIPDFLKEVNAIIKPNIELVFHDDIFAVN